MSPFPYTLIDLTHALNEATPSWHDGCGFAHATQCDFSDYPADAPVKFRAHTVKMNAGIGTHIDSPSHCHRDGDSVEAIPLETLAAPLIVIDVRHKMAADCKVTLQDLSDFEKAHGPLPARAFTAFHTGWGEYWNDPDQYRNNHQFPSISAEVANFLLSKNTLGVGIDTLSPDLPNSGFPVHKSILGAGKYIVENVANLDQMPQKGAYIMTLPLKGEGLSEAPVRMIGLIHKDL